MEKSSKKVCLGIVMDPVAKSGTLPFSDWDYELRRATYNQWNNPQKNFDRGVTAMILAYKERGPFDYLALIGECGLPDVVLSSQCFFSQEVAESFRKAGIDVEVEAIAATSNKFWSEEIVEPIETDAGMKLSKMERKTCQVSQGKVYSYYFDHFNYDENVAVYKFTKK
jgi:hypothetical protein